MQVERNPSSTFLTKSDLAFPSDKELAQFQKQSNTHTVSSRECLINLWREFRKGTNSKNGVIIKSIFMKILKKDLKLYNDNISEHLFRRNLYLGFGVREYVKKGQVEIITNDIELHDIMLALTLLSRIPNEKKIELIFDLTDVDEDGCLSPDEVYKMIEVIERIFSKENTEMNINSRVLLEKLSRDKALRRYEWVMRSIGMLKSRSKNDEGLITFEEFRNVLDKVPNLKAQFLPRYTDLKSVLKNENSEPEIHVDERNLEDFLIFRYELQALFSDNLKSNRKKKLPPLKKLGKSNDSKIWKKECPGLINGGETSKKLSIPKDYWELNSNNNTILVREKNTDKGEAVCKHYDREEAIEKIIPQREVQKALQDLKKGHESSSHYKNEDDEAAGYENLVNKVKNQVADTKKKQIEVGEVQTISRKSDFKFLNERSSSNY
ncbi:hypothetical protein SteCoe_15855 [Stentor coeruleus]|uniref:EF-hand domain-containing protein n=1 Tax=Stentor coeruleus TaxID=5963 RepID=A0A1R2C2P8_9CILI|nr:hypothetical protein SteCoe_15855 [Stentor coeruleus]